MVGTIIPIGYGEGQFRRLKLFGLHIIGYLGGATLLGLLAGGLGRVIFGRTTTNPASTIVILSSAIICLLYSLREFDLLRVPAPQVDWRVPRNWRSLPPWLMGLSYGVVLGVGFLTYLPVSSLHVATAWVFLSQSPLRGACTLAGFGLGRSLALLWMAVRYHKYRDIKIIVSDLPRWEMLVPVGNGFVLAFAATYLFTSIL